MKRWSFVALLAFALLALWMVGGAQAEVGGAGDGATGSPSPDQTLLDATGCVDTSSTWYGKGQNISTNSGTHWAGVIYVHIPPADPTKIPTFCTDLGTTISQGKCFVADGPTACPITWLLNNGYGPNDPATNAESAARQAAVWYFSDGLLVTPSDPVYGRTQTIIAAVPNPCVLPQSAPVMTLEPASAINFLPGGEVHAMTVMVTQDGAPVAGKVVNLSTTFGTLSANSVTTGADGRASFTLTSNSTGSATVTANFSYVLPAGTRMVKLPGQPDQQVIVLGTPQTGNVIATASKMWDSGAKIIVHKFSDNNTNGVQDGGEESLSGWTMKLYRWTGSGWDLVATKATDAAGNAIYDNMSLGTYRAEETLQSGWFNTTPNPSAQVTLPAGGQATINFGNVALAVIRAWKFHDLNMDGVRDPGEPVLDGWEMNIFPAINGIGSGLTAGGSFSFIDLPPGEYRVWETQQADWRPTTPTEQLVTVGANDFAEVWFGNVRVDMGDLPDTGPGTGSGNYQTVSSDNGPSHLMDANLRLGACVDAEADGQPNAGATGDNQSTGNLVYGTCTPAGNDEDGVTVPVLNAGMTSVAVPVRATNVSPAAAATLRCWFDFNHNGTLTDTGEMQWTTVPPNTNNGLFTLTFSGFATPLPTGDTFLRCRIAYNAGEVANPTGAAASGEVEDYVAPTNPLAVTLAAFDARPYGDGALVSWETVSEINNTGFNLYRAEDADGPRTLLAFLASPAPGGSQGQAYSYVDAPLTAGQTYWYWIEDISTSGTATLHGPVNATVQSPTAVGLAGVQAASAGTARLAWPAVLALLVLGMIGGVGQSRRAQQPG